MKLNTLNLLNKIGRALVLMMVALYFSVEVFAQDKPVMQTEKVTDTAFTSPPEKVSTPEQELNDIKKTERITIDREIIPTSQIVTSDETQTAIYISLRDVSRIVCDKAVQRIVYSKEKGFEAKVEGKNVFIKNLPSERMMPDGGLRHEYDASPKELFLVCGDRVFTLIMFPKDVPSVTIYLKSPIKDKSKAIESERGLPYESFLVSFIKNMYEEQLPDGYEAVDINKKVKEFEEFALYHKTSYIGGLYKGHELVIESKKDIRIDEASLLQNYPLGNVLAVSVVKHQLRGKDNTRVFIITRGNDNE